MDIMAFNDFFKNKHTGFLKRRTLSRQLLQGCDQYTLTREQLMQKEQKRERTREYQIIKSYSGYWFPLSQV